MVSVFQNDIKRENTLFVKIGSILEGLIVWSGFKSYHALLYAPILLGLGIGAYFSLNFEPSYQLTFNLWAGSLALLLLCHQIFLLRPEVGICRVITFIICLIISGFFLAQYRTIQVHSPMLTKPLKFANITGTIQEIDVLSEQNGARIILSNLEIEELARDKTPYSVRLKVQGDINNLQSGDRVKVFASLNPPSPPVAPNAFDFQQQSYFKRLGAVGFTYRPPEILERKKLKDFHQFWEGLRLSITNKIKSVLPEHIQGVMITFLTGEKSSISPDNLQAMRDSGLAHLLAISGLHVGLVAGFVFYFLRLGLAFFPSIALSYPIKKWAAAAALLFAFFYMFLVGASIPTQRAMMMTGIALFAVMINRSPFSLRMVALAAVIILICYPEALISASFQMSFAAVAALVAFYDFFRPHIQFLYREAGFLRKTFLYILGIATTTIIAGSATALYGLYHFQAWSLYSTLANILAMPLMGLLVMPLAVICYLLMPLGLADYPLMIMGYGVEQVLVIAHYVAGLEGAVLKFPAFSPYLAGAISFFGLLVMLGPYFLRILGAIFLIICLFVLILTPSHTRLYISENGKLIGLYDASLDKLFLSSLRSERYARENWARRLGLNNQDIEKFEENNNIMCDDSGCRAVIENIKVSMTDNLYTLQEECLWADIVISVRSVSTKCKAATIIDPARLQKSGAIEITFDHNNFRVNSVSQSRGKRLWTQ